MKKKMKKKMPEWRADPAEFVRRWKIKEGPDALPGDPLNIRFCPPHLFPEMVELWCKEEFLERADRMRTNRGMMKMLHRCGARRLEDHTRAKFEQMKKDAGEGEQPLELDAAFLAMKETHTGEKGPYTTRAGDTIAHFETALADGKRQAREKGWDNTQLERFVHEKLVEKAREQQKSGRLPGITGLIPRESEALRSTSSSMRTVLSSQASTCSQGGVFLTQEQLEARESALIDRVRAEVTASITADLTASLSATMEARFADLLAAMDGAGVDIRRVGAHIGRPRHRSDARHPDRHRRRHRDRRRRRRRDETPSDASSSDSEEEDAAPGEQSDRAGESGGTGEASSSESSESSEDSE